MLKKLLEIFKDIKGVMPFHDGNYTLPEAMAMIHCQEAIAMLEKSNFLNSATMAFLLNCLRELENIMPNTYEVYNLGEVKAMVECQEGIKMIESWED